MDVYKQSFLFLSQLELNCVLSSCFEMTLLKDISVSASVHSDLADLTQIPPLYCNFPAPYLLQSVPRGQSHLLIV